MDIARIKSFLDARKAGGISERDTRDLLALAGGRLTEAQERLLQRLVEQSGSAFTPNGKRAFDKLTGAPASAPPSGGTAAAGSSAMDVRLGRVPRAWDQITRVGGVMQRLIDEGESVQLRLGSGRVIGLEANERMTEFVEKGYLKLYKNERDSSDYDDNGRVLWSAGYYLVPTPAFKIVEDQIERFSKQGDRITKEITRALESLHRVMHASRVNGDNSASELKAIKREVAAELPKAKQAIVDYEAAVNKFAADTQHIDYPNGDVWLMMFAKDALKVTGPRIEALSLRDLAFTKDLIRANELLLSRPEVEAVDPGFGIRIQVNTDVLVKNGGDYPKWKADVQRLMHDALITGELNFDKNNNEEGVLAEAQRLLHKAVGKANVRDGYAIGDKDFPDGVRGTEVTLYVKPAALAEAKRHVDELRALFAPHGMDMKHFVVTIEAER